MLFRLLFGGDQVSSYTVFEAPEPPADRLDRAGALVFVKDGFSIQAMLFAPLWLMTRRAWLALLGYVLWVAALIAVDLVFAVDAAYLLTALAALHLIVGYEAGAIERHAFEHRGWSRLGELVGSSLQDCERRFLDIWLPMQPGVRTSSTAARPADKAPAQPSTTTAERPRGVVARLLRRKS